MKRIKRTLAALLTVVLTLALLGEAVFADNSEQPVWPEEGAIQLSKSAAAVEGKENTWEVTLGIQGKNYKTTSDVVLVIDNSNSMHPSKTSKEDRMTKTKAAANAFVDTLLTEDSTTRIALVVYNLTETHTGFYTYENKAALKSKINAIEQDNDNGGTFTQLGLHTARTLLNSAESTGQNKSIVLLSDGEPTKAYEFVAVNATYTNCQSSHGLVFNRNHSGGQFKADTFLPDYNLTLGDGGTNDFGTYSHNAIASSVTCNKGVSRDIDCNYYKYKDSSDNWVYTTNVVKTDLGVPTMWEAEQATAESTTVYTVAFQAGTDGERVLKACATNPTKGFFAISSSTNIETALKDAFTSIAGSISIAARAGSVADTMGDNVQLVFKDAAPIITTDMAVYAAGNADVYISQGTASYDSATRAIHWTVGNVSEQDKPVMKYRVTIKSGCNPSTGETLLTNEQATFSYIDYLGRDAEAEFPKPAVTVGGGKLLVHWYQ